MCWDKGKRKMHKGRTMVKTIFFENFTNWNPRIDFQKQLSKPFKNCSLTSFSRFCVNAGIYNFDDFSPLISLFGGEKKRNQESCDYQILWIVISRCTLSIRSWKKYLDGILAPEWMRCINCNWTTFSVKRYT